MSDRLRGTAPWTAPTLRRVRSSRSGAGCIVRRARWPGILAPVVIGLVVLGLWEFLVRSRRSPPTSCPARWLIAETLVRRLGDAVGRAAGSRLQSPRSRCSPPSCSACCWRSLFTQSNGWRLSLFPYAVILQVTPIVAIAPLIIIWVNDINAVAADLRLDRRLLPDPVEHHPRAELGRPQPASTCSSSTAPRRWQTLRYLRLPAALPYFLGGLRISGGLALIGAVVAEFVAGTGGTGSGLAYRILESGYQLKIPRMFAALVLISADRHRDLPGLSLLSHLLLRRWHESAMKREN